MTGSVLRVGLIVPRFAPYHGGVESCSADAAAGLAAKGAEVTVVTQIPRGLGLPMRDRQDGYTIERHHLPLGGNFDVPSPAAARAASQSGRFDVVWVQNYHTPLAWLAAAQSKAPVVLTPHYHGGGHTRFRNALHPLYRPAGRRLMAASSRIVVDSEAEAELLRRDFPRNILREKITVVPLPVADPTAGWQPYPGESNIVLTVARQEPYKRTDLLIRAVAELRDRGVPARLVVVGKGSGLAAYQELAAQLRANDVVKFTGAADDVSLGRWWASASMYATASHHEAFGICLGEALVAGLPVVASGIPAHRELVSMAGPGAMVRLCRPDIPNDEAASEYADAIAGLLGAMQSREERAARCTLLGVSDVVDQLFETLSAAGS
jgi:glycosyltransferase involved in cell wall biosynthesis